MRAWNVVLAVAVPVLLGSCLQSVAFAAPLACQARISSATGSMPLNVEFQALAGGGIGPYDFEWDFGDGGTATIQNPSHTYTEPGLFHAEVTVTDVGSQETCRDTALVPAGLAIDFECVASASTRWVDAPDVVVFNGYGVFGCASGPQTWTWTFGDGQQFAGPWADHVYSQPGTYWAVGTLNTPTRSCDCYPTLRISVLVPGNTAVGPRALEDGLRIEPARPNPFGAVTTIAYDLPQPGHTRLTILDVGGRVMAELVNGFRPAGRATSIWHASTGRVAPPGLYVARLEHGGEVRSTRLVRMR